MNLKEYKKRNKLPLHQLAFLLKVDGRRLKNLLEGKAELTQRERLALVLADTSLPLEVKSEKIDRTYIITLDGVPFSLHPWQVKDMDTGALTADDDNIFLICKYKGREVVKIIQRGVTA